jgi:hypothetical protein
MGGFCGGEMVCGAFFRAFIEMNNLFNKILNF